MYAIRMSDLTSIKRGSAALLLMITLILLGGAVAAVSVTARSVIRTQNNPPARQEAELRRSLAGTCEGMNLELADAAATQTRIGRQAEAARLLSMRQNCDARPRGR
jgi:hypothetical protein